MLAHFGVLEQACEAGDDQGEGELMSGSPPSSHDLRRSEEACQGIAAAR